MSKPVAVEMGFTHEHAVKVRHTGRYYIFWGMSGSAARILFHEMGLFDIENIQNALWNGGRIDVP